MNVKHLLSLAALALMFSACGGSDDDPVNPTPKQEETPTITIDSSVTTNELAFTNEAGEKSITFTASEAWTLSVAATRDGSAWCVPSQTSGTAGTVTIKFTVTANDAYDDRSVSVTLKCGTVTKTFTITQKGVDALLLTTDKYEVGQEGGTIEVEVKANIDYQMEIAASAKGWITQASTRSLTTRTYKFNIAANEELAQREGEIHFKSGDKVETVKVYQSGATPVLVLGQKEITVSDAGETISVDIKSNVEFDVQMPSVSWITEAATRGMSSHTVKFTVQPNEEYDSRTAQIIFMEKDGSLKDTLTVTQAQKDAIVLTEKEMTIEAAGGTLTVKLKANVDVTTTIADDCKDWISIPKTRGLVDKDVTLTIAENTAESARTGSVTFSAEGLSETVTITQEENVPEDFDGLVITVPEAGWLKNVDLSTINSNSLKIKGNLNGTDIRVILSWAATERELLDLSKAHIVSGGESAYSYNDYGYTEGYYTEDNVIGKYMFGEGKNVGGGSVDATKISKIILPTDVISIERSAFSGCGNLTSIDIPSSVTSIEERAFSGCSSLTSVVIPSGVTSIEDRVFLGCSSLKSIDIPSDITYIGWYAFNGCSSLTSIDIPSSVTSIKPYAFWMCSSLTSVIIPEGITSINAFDGCSSLTSVKLPNSLSSIDGFSGCSSLINIEIPISVTSIEERAFMGCSSLTNIEIPSSVTSIGYEAFKSCSSLTKLNIPSGVTSIGSYAFRNCGSLTSIYSYIQEPFAVSMVISDDNNITLYVPKGTKGIYSITTGWNKFKEIKEMEE